MAWAICVHTCRLSGVGDARSSTIGGTNRCRGRFTNWPFQLALFKRATIRNPPKEALSAMISGGNATIYVANMDAAVRFYTDVLGLKLTNRFGERWATVEAGPSYWTPDEVGAGLVIGLHPASPKHPAPGTKGAVMFGLETYKPIEDVVSRLADRVFGRRGDHQIRGRQHRRDRRSWTGTDLPGGTRTGDGADESDSYPGRAGCGARKLRLPYCPEGTQPSTSPAWMPPCASTPRSSG